VSRKPRPAEIILVVSLVGLFGLLIIARPPLVYLTLFLAPIALAAVLYEFTGGTLVALGVMIGVALLVALDPDTYRRATMLKEVWPILVAYLVVGPLIGWFVARERERQDQLNAATRRLRQVEQERAGALEAIREAGQEIAASHDLDRTLQLVMDKAAETLPMDAGALFVFDEPAQLYRVAVSHNLPQEQVDNITFAFDEGVPGWVVRQREPLIINDASADQRVHPYVVELGVQSVMAIPLITREQILGVLNLFGLSGVNAFDDEALRLAQVYADQAAVFIENARLVQELTEAAAELEARVDQRTRELRDSQAQVVRAEKMAAVGRLAASVAHEVNNPLQAIALHLQLVADENADDASQEQIEIVQHELDRIAGIVKRLLDFQRPKEGRRSIQSVPDLLDDVLALAGKQLQRSNISLICRLEDGLPPVLAAGDQLQQVFLNLVLNAVEAMPDGGQLTVDGFRRAGNIIVQFADNGAGIALEDMDQLFEPFFSTKHTGSGLGLAVSQEIVSNHGGRLQATNRPQGGAVFTVTLPVYFETERETLL
jgi:two-component system NtrC family sensor kinase